jgi:hypothetical protein
MTEHLLTFIDTVIAVILVLALIVLYRFARRLEKKEDATKPSISIKEESHYNVEVQRIICRLKNELQATKIVIARFHDGGNYVNGLHMSKHSITFETEGGAYIPMMDKCVGVFNSRYSLALAHLASMGDFCISERDACEDLNFSRDMKEYDLQSTNLFLMRQFDGSDEGFIGVNFRHTHVMDKEHRDKVKEQIPIIIGLLNMEK